MNVFGNVNMRKIVDAHARNEVFLGSRGCLSVCSCGYILFISLFFFFFYSLKASILFEGQTHTKNPCATDISNQGNDQERNNKKKKTNKRNERMENKGKLINSK